MFSICSICSACSPHVSQMSSSLFPSTVCPPCFSRDQPGGSSSTTAAWSDFPIGTTMMGWSWNTAWWYTYLALWKMMELKSVGIILPTYIYIWKVTKFMFQTTNQSWVDHGTSWDILIFDDMIWISAWTLSEMLALLNESPVEFISWDHPQLSCTHYDVIMISISYLPLLEAYHDHVYWCPVFLRSWASPGLISNPTNIHRKSKSSHNPRTCRNECTSYYSRISCMKNLNGCYMAVCQNPGTPSEHQNNW